MYPYASKQYEHMNTGGGDGERGTEKEIAVPHFYWEFCEP